jgi:hypothetical protein
VEAITLAAVGTAVLMEGIKFLYAQAGEAIKWWRERHDRPDAVAETLPLVPDAPLEGTLEPPRVDPAVMERLEEEIRGLRSALAPYADPIAAEPVDPANQDLVAVVEGLRDALEAVLGQRITFRGESRGPSGPLAVGEVDVDTVAGYAAGVRARSIEGGVVRGTVRAKTVEKGGKAVGVDADRIGGR